MSSLQTPWAQASQRSTVIFLVLGLSMTNGSACQKITDLAVGLEREGLTLFDGGLAGAGGNGADALLTPRAGVTGYRHTVMTCQMGVCLHAETRNPVLWCRAGRPVEVPVPPPGSALSSLSVWKQDVSGDETLLCIT